MFLKLIEVSVLTGAFPVLKIVDKLFAGFLTVIVDGSQASAAAASTLLTSDDGQLVFVKKRSWILPVFLRKAVLDPP